jgi:hypothetical protein
MSEFSTVQPESREPVIDESLVVEPEAPEVEGGDDDKIKKDAILKALAKGPAAPFEIAVRTFSFPEELMNPLNELEREGFIMSEKLKTGQMYSLTAAGQNRLRNEAHLRP